MHPPTDPPTEPHDWSALSNRRLRAEFARHNRLYHDEGRPELADADYDLLREEYERRFGQAPVVPGARGKVRLPFPMASLNKPKQFDRWLAAHPGPLLLSEKLDGISAMVVRSGDSLRLLSRGDGLHGQDISHILPHIQHNLRKSAERHEFVLRAELVRPRALPLPRGYATARNLVASVTTALRPAPALLADLQLVYYAIYTLDGQPVPFERQFEALGRLVKRVVWHQEITAKLIPSGITPEGLLELLRHRKRESDFDIDGLVVASAVGAPAGPPTVLENPRHAVAFKENSLGASAETEVRGVEWNLSKDYRLKPTVLLEPVLLDGVRVARATGFNARFVRDHGVGPGARVRVVRSGDVIPFIQEVLDPVEAAAPQQAHVFDGVDYLAEDRGEANVSALVHFFKKLGVAGMQEGTLRRLVDAGHDTPAAILALSEAHLREIDGFQATLARKLHTAMRAAARDATLVQWMAASNCFKGLAEKKLAKALDAVPNLLQLPRAQARAALLQVPGFADKSADALLEGLPAFRQLLHDTRAAPTAPEQKSAATATNAEVYVFSGFRDAALAAALAAAGRRVEDSLTKRTTHLVIKDPAKATAKVRKAREQGVTIVVAADLAELLAAAGP